MDVLDEVVKTGEYVGSGKYTPKTGKVKHTIRFDYFESPVTINEGNYLVAFDVEVFPNTNNYRTHRVINEMDIVPIDSATDAHQLQIEGRADVGTHQPQGLEEQSPSTDTMLPRPGEGVKGQYAQEGEEYALSGRELLEKAARQAAESGRISDQEADRLLQERTMVDFLARKGGLSLTKDMDQSQKRDAVRKAMENLLGEQKTASTGKPRMRMEDFTSTDSPVWRNVDYKDTETKSQITQATHQEMVEEGRVVKIPETTMRQVGESFPDLRTKKKADRAATLRQKMTELKTSLRQFLNGMKGTSFEFEVNGNILEATLYGTGISEVMEKVTKEKASMLYHSAEIFSTAQYLYSTPDYDGDPNIYRWNYFYTPVQIGDETVGVRIAVKDLKNPQESQLYHWGIKKDTSLDGDGRREILRSPAGVSSDVPSDPMIPQSKDGVKDLYAPEGEEYAQSGRELLEKAARQAAESVRISDQEADRLLQERTMVDFLTRKGGLSLTKDMDQSQKRDAVRKAMENLLNKGKVVPASYEEFSVMTGFPGIMTEREFASRKPSGYADYQEYLNAMFQKYNKG